MMARTKITPTLHPSIAEVAGQRMEGLSVSFDDFSVTNDADTTATMYIGGLIPWRLINESGGSLTFTFYSARALDGTELTPYDQEGQAVIMVTIGDDCDMELPNGLAGVMWLVIKGSAALSSGITLVCKR